MSRRVIDVFLFSAKWNSAVIYFDDIFVISKTIEQNLNHFQRVSTLLRNANVALQLKKRSFCEKTINYLCSVIHPATQELEESTTDAIQQLHEPSTQMETQLFLGLWNVL